MNALPQGPLVAWYGDDFTGSSAVLEALTFAGLPSVLFLDIPTREQLELFPGSRGIGIASTARAHGPAWMDENLPPAFDWLRRLNAPVTHYKVCSTFDSAPHVGSIGRAIDIAAPRFGGDWIPLLIAVPEMRRYQCFGHFFAGSPQGVFRLDRHPVMARHPVTPMNESDVRLHLGAANAAPHRPDRHRGARRRRGCRVAQADRGRRADHRHRRHGRTPAHRSRPACLGTSWRGPVRRRARKGSNSH